MGNPLNILLIVCVAISFLIIQAAALLWFGQPLICTCGHVKLWEGVILSSGNSQHITDWYTFTHLIQGFLFYFLTWVVFPKMPVSQRFLIALGIEVSWEIIENTPMVIEHYRQQALASGYIGDSVINSISDSLTMIIGFIIAARFPLLLTLALAITLEIWLGITVRDNLTLNIINLIYTFPAIHAWQAGAV
jgi:hypothetical protein